jgi:hypothetical protein
MIGCMKDRVITSLAWIIGTVGMAGSVLAQDNENPIDGRMIGYKQQVALDGSVAVTWLLLIFLMIVCISPLFMNARRTHLD